MAFSLYDTTNNLPSSLEQMLSEITCFRKREFRQIASEDAGFIIVNPTTFWIDLFVRNYLYNKDDKSRDDLLFFIRKIPKRVNAKYFPQFETLIEVYRKDSKKLPIGDTEIDWEETVFLNLILQQLDYTLTCAVCTRTSSKDLQVIRKHSQRVYASPSRRSMSCKGETEEMTYPNIFFMVDDYEEVFQDILIQDGEMLCVELLASDREGKFQAVIFLGALHYEPLRKVYDARGSLSSKFAQRMGWHPGHQRMEYVRMKGPDAKGHAEMAVARQKGSGVETPTSEPGFSLTDFDWDDLEDNPYQQRRMSDPSSNLNHFIRGSMKNSSHMKKSCSENEGVDCYANGVNEIEACDIRDDMNKPSTSAQNNHVDTIYEELISNPITEAVSHKAPKEKELDDSTYNRLWMMKGFSQAYHFWKESRRASSPSLHAYLTYVTLTWHQIISDLMTDRQSPILTF